MITYLANFLSRCAIHTRIKKLSVSDEASLRERVPWAKIDELVPQLVAVDVLLKHSAL